MEVPDVSCGSPPGLKRDRSRFWSCLRPDDFGDAEMASLPSGDVDGIVPHARSSAEQHRRRCKNIAKLCMPAAWRLSWFDRDNYRMLLCCT